MKNPIIKSIIGTEKYFVHKGTWKNEYEWRIQKVKIVGLKLDEKGKLFCEFSFNSCGYEYPVSYLKSTLKEAKRFAISEINKEKIKQIKLIENIKS